MSHKTYKHNFTYKQTHKCTLDKVDLGEDDFPSYPPYAPSCIKHLYWFTKTWMTVNYLHPQARVHFRSKSALVNEKRRQLENVSFRMIVHPFSVLALIHKIIGVGLWTGVFFIDPFLTSFVYSVIDHRDVKDYYVMTALNAALFFYSISFFFIGFATNGTKEIVLDQRRITRKYLSTYFIVDFLPLVHQMLFYFNSQHYIYYISVPVHFIRFLRIFTMVSYLDEIFCFYSIPENVAKCITVAILQIIIIHWWSCFFYLVPTIAYNLHFPNTDSWVLKTSVGTSRILSNIYLETTMSVACHYFGASKGNIITGNPAEQLILAIVKLFGLSVELYTVASILLIFGTINISESKYEEMMVQLNDYMRAKRLPLELKKRLNLYYKHRFQKQFFHEEIILSGLSEHLRCEVLLYSCNNLIQKMRLLRDASKEVIGAIVSMLKQEIFLPNDVIVKKDTFNEHVYFVSYGTVAIYLDDGSEFLHLEDGQHFGEVSVVMQQSLKQFRADTVALEVTEVFYLVKKDMIYLTSIDPDIAFRIEQSVRDKIIRYETALQQSVVKIDTSDILSELKRGRILERRRKRL